MEFAISRSQHAIAKREGRFVCSSVDPISEAEKWVERHASSCGGVCHVFVLGVGCGYHLVQLQNRFPELKIIAFDLSIELMEFSAREHALELSDVQFVHFSKVQDVSGSAKVKKGLRSPYVVVKFPGAIGADEDLYRNIEELLLGRTDAALQFLYSARPDIQKIFEIEKVEHSAQKLMSIRALEPALNLERPEGALLFKALGELIA